MIEKLRLNDGKEVEVSCKFLSTRKAFQIFENAVDIKSVKTIDVKRIDENGKETIIKEPLMEGKLSGLVSLSWRCFDECVENFPEKDNVSPDEVLRIYQKYAEKIINQLMGATPNPKSSEN